MIGLLLVLNGFLFASLLFGAMWGLKLYRRFFIVLDRKTDAVDFALNQCRVEVDKVKRLVERVQELEDNQQKVAISKLSGKR